MKRGEADLTEEQLAQAWRQMRKPAGWPATLAQAMQHPARKASIPGYARAMLRAAALRAQSAGQAPTQPAPRAMAQTRMPTLPRNAFDARRAAANDLDQGE